MKILRKELVTMSTEVNLIRKTQAILIVCLLSFYSANLFAVVKTSTGTGNWSTAGTWSPAGVPAIDDDVVVLSGHTITVDGTYTCNHLTFGNATNSNATIQITSASNSLTINGNLELNPGNRGRTYILNAGPGTLNIAGNITYWSSSGTNSIRVSTGTINFTNAVTIANAAGNITFTAAGTINFNSSFTDQYNRLVTFAGCVVNFNGNYTVNTTAATWAAMGTANFANGTSITATSNLTLNDVNINTSASATINSAAGTLIVGGNLTLASGATLTTNRNFEVGGNWTNNGGTFAGTADTVIFNGSAKVIGGSSATSFGTVQIGRTAGATAVSCTLERNKTFAQLIINGSTVARTLNLASGVTLTVSNDLTIVQPTGAVVSALNVDEGTCNVNGNLLFSGTNATTTRIGRVAVTSGTFTLAGTVTWMSNTAVTTEVITVSTGVVNLNSSITMGTGSGTLSVTSTGTINFNGSSAPSLNFGGAATSPVLTTTNGCTLNFANGFTNNSVALTLAATSQIDMSGSGTITPNAAITFGHLQINPSVSATLAAGSAVVVAGNLTLNTGSSLTTNQNFELGGNWVNNGGTFSGSAYTVTLNGAGKTISGSTPTTFGTVQIGRTAGITAVSYTMENDNTIGFVVYNASTVARTLTLSSGITLTVSNNVTINQPTGAVTNLLGVNDGSCAINGNLILTGTNNTVSRVARIEVANGDLDINGSVTWMANTAVATEVITVSTGSIRFGSSLSMGTGTGTLTVTGTGTIHFDGNAPSFSFGGATAPIFTTTNGCILNFNAGFTNSNNALTLAEFSQTNFTGNGTITPTAAITFGHLAINSSSTITLAGNISVRGNWENEGSLIPSTHTVTFNGTADQSITNTTGETFYNLTLSNASSTINTVGNLMITNAFNMNVTGINLNGNTFTLGNNAGATLTRTSGTIYGGTFKRWFPATAITSNSGAYYGLFPVGTSTAYRPVAINSTASPSVAGFVMVNHTDQLTTTSVSYTDNEGVNIEIISDKTSAITTSDLSGGTFDIDVTFSDLSATGNTSDLYLVTYTGNEMGSAGTSATTTGTASAPTVKRTGLTASQLANVWVVGSKDKTATPIRNTLFTRKSGNWNDVTIGTGTWSWIEGGAGASCDCTPTVLDNVIISTGQTVTITATTSANNVEVGNGATLKDDGVAGFTVTENLILTGTGKIENSSTWSVGGEFNLPSSSESISTGTLTLSGDVVINGEISIGSGTLNLTTGNSISGSGTIITTGGGTIQISNNKTITTGSDITIGSLSAPVTLHISGSTTVTNNGTVSLYGSLTGSVAGSTWVNAANATLKVSDALLTTGTLTATAADNTVEYNGSGDQTIKTPSASYYNLTISNAGTKTMSSSFSVQNAIAIQDNAVVDQTTYVLSGAASLSMSGNSELKLQRGSTGTYPELSGTYTLSGGTVTLRQTNASVTVTSANYYNLKLSGSRPFNLSSVSSITNNLELTESASISSNAEMTIGGTFIYSCSEVSSLSSNITVGGVSITSGTFSDNGRTIAINGSAGWSKTGGTFTSTGTISFTGATAQEIGGSEPSTFFNLVINNGAGVSLNLIPGAVTVISNSLTLTNGVLHTSASNRLHMLDNSVCYGGSSASYVDGPMVKIGNDDFIFPIGKNGRIRKAGISGIVDVLTEVSAEYYAEAYTNLTPVSGDILDVSNQEYWMIDRAGSTDGVKLRLFWEGPTNVVNCGSLKLAHWEGGEWKEEPAAVVSGSVCNNGGSGSIESAGLLTTFSPFTFGDGGGALPIKLVSFDAVAQDDKVLTTWTTSLEINNAYFTVERSADGEVFSEVTRVDGANNSTTLLNYQAVDVNPLSGISYYRLKQTDFDGTFAYSEMVSVKRENAASIRLYPNPAESEFFVGVENVKGAVQIDIYDVSGYRVFTNIYQLDEWSTTSTIQIPVRDILPVGIYFVLLEARGTQLKEKLIVR